MNRFRGKAFEMWIEDVKESKGYVSNFNEMEHTVVTNNGIVSIINPELRFETSFGEFALKCGNANKNFMRFVLDANENVVIDIPMENIILIKSEGKRCWDYEDGKKWLELQNETI